MTEEQQKEDVSDPKQNDKSSYCVDSNCKIPSSENSEIEQEQRQLGQRCGGYPETRICEDKLVTVSNCFRQAHLRRTYFECDFKNILAKQDGVLLMHTDHTRVCT
jgi:hypothetical protein